MTESRGYVPLYRQSSVSIPTDPIRDSKDIPLRAKSVCLSERPRSKYERTARSADNRHRYTPKHKDFVFQRRPSKLKRIPKPSKVIVKPQVRKVAEKIPCAISVQTLSIPMKYADYGHSTSKNHNLCNTERVDSRTKTSNPPKQVSDNKRLCATLGCGKETENKLLVQISEADQVSDFERILNSNAILCERAHRHVWRGCRATNTAPVLRPQSAYSLHAVSKAYHFLFRQHEESLQPLIDSYRRAAASDAPKTCPAAASSLLQDNWYEHLQELSEFYEDDPALRQEIESITDRIISEEIQTVEVPKPSARAKNFNVNLTDLIGLRVNGEGYSPVSVYDGPSPDVDKGPETDVYDEKEWLDPIMTSNSTDQLNSKEHNDSVDRLAQNLNSVKLDSDAKVPSITFSNCCDGCTRGERPDNIDIAIHLAVPSADREDEARPPMM